MRAIILDVPRKLTFTNMKENIRGPSSAYSIDFRPIMSNE